MLALDVIFGSPIMPDLLGIVAGHLYYFLTVLHPLAGGRNILKTPIWVYPFFPYYDETFLNNAILLDYFFPRWISFDFREMQ